MAIKFRKDDHTYCDKDDENVKYHSVTTVISSFKNKFRKEYWSTYKALQRLYTKEEWKKVTKGFRPGEDALIIHAQKFVDQDDLIEKQKEVLAEWDAKNKKSILRGNKYHDSREQNSYERGYEQNPFTGVDVPLGKQNFNMFEEDSSDPAKGSNILDVKHSIDNNLFRLEDGFYPELLIWNHDIVGSDGEPIRIAGQADKVFIETDKKTGIRYIDVDDYKTNNKIKMKGYRGQTMKTPLDKFQDCNYNHYRLQISFYAWMLEQFGFEVRHTAFHHYNKKHQFEYLKKDVENMIKVFGNQ